ncbi:uncharacterized protein LOC120894855 isoform X2 [Anopheles arabiensis]|uniref:uncharacterized protein LOC120894855 isoform X2 n=1 Tax=Anopheles arabiensis TaxID=7173 RepID=UPI001AAC518C|nr:uncharacterized protein LOC120894855 isoform X2 [Anopheles arabiensis]
MYSQNLGPFGTFHGTVNTTRDEGVTGAIPVFKTAAGFASGGVKSTSLRLGALRWGALREAQSTSPGRELSGVVVVVIFSVLGIFRVVLVAYVFCVFIDVSMSVIDNSSKKAPFPRRRASMQLGHNQSEWESTRFNSSTAASLISRSRAGWTHFRHSW